MILFKLRLYFLLLLSFFSTMAFATNDNNQKLAEALDKFHYQVAVEWDQQNIGFIQAAGEELEDSLISLRSEGITEDEIQNYLKGHVLNERTAKDYDRFLSALKMGSLSQDKILKIMLDYIKVQYQEGVSFSAGAYRRFRTPALILSSVIIVVIVANLTIKKFRKEVRDETEARIQKLLEELYMHGSV